LVDKLKRVLAKRALNAEMDHHLDGEVAEGRPNSRNGYGQKTLLTDSGKLPILVSRDRLSTFVSYMDRKAPLPDLVRAPDQPNRLGTCPGY
jgi:transposase-like protein